MNSDLYEDKPMTFEYMMSHFRTQFVDKPEFSDLEHMRFRVLDRWSIYLLSLGDIIMKDATIIGPRIGMCANEIHTKSSKIDSSFKGCLPDTGLGNAKRHVSCAGSGGSHGG
jgi:hypothetical protein